MAARERVPDQGTATAPTLPRQRSDAWLSRFGTRPPTLAEMLLTRVRLAVGAGGDDPAVREAAAALGVLRAQQRHTIGGLLDDVLALRMATNAEPALVDAVTLAAAEAFVDELTAILQRQATRDPLTGLPNRAAFDEALRHEVAAASRGAAPSLLVVDLDGFKAVNDTDGHLAGDAVLVAVGDVLTHAVRRGDVVARLGGDEFAVVLPRTSRRRAGVVAGRILESARQAAGLASENARVTFSIGVAWLRDPRSPDDLVAMADAALYRVKAEGGDGVQTGRASDRPPLELPEQP